MHTSEEQAEQLSQLAKTKLSISMQNITNTILSFEDPEGYWAEIDGIHTGAGNKEVWEIEFDEDLVAVFIGKSFEQVNAMISGLPDKLSDEQYRQVIGKAKVLYPDARLVYVPCGVEECRVVLDKIPGDYRSKRVVIDHIPVQLVIDPKRRITVPAKAII